MRVDALSDVGATPTSITPGGADHGNILVSPDHLLQ